MEFVVPPVDSSVFFPISVQFSATSTFSDLKVCRNSSVSSENILQLVPFFLLLFVHLLLMN